MILRTALLIVLVGCGWPPIGAADECGGSIPCQCGDKVSSDYHMTADLGPCSAHGLHVASDVTLDCRSHVVRGPGGRGEHFGIYLAKGTTRATVKNCEVTGFMRGIRLQGAHHNRLIDNQVHHNGDSTRHTGYGIDVAAASTANVLQGNRVHDNADEGIHVGAGSDRNTLIGNHVYANFRENIYVLRANGGVFQHNVTHGGVNSLFLKHAAFNRFEHNTFRDRTAVLRGDSHDNQLVSNDFINAGLHVQAYQEGATLTRPTRNVVAGGTIVEAKPCVRFSGASGNLVKGIRLSRCATAVVSTGVGAAIENTLIDMALKANDVSLDERSRVRVGWQLNVSVKSANGSALGGVKVQGFDVHNNLVFDAVTAPDGRIPIQEVMQYSQSGSAKTYDTPHTLRATANGLTASQKVAIDSDKAVTLSIPPAHR
jgi:parallel beta-helix repeat protein